MNIHMDLGFAHSIIFISNMVGLARDCYLAINDLFVNHMLEIHYYGIQLN